MLYWGRVRIHFATAGSRTEFAAQSSQFDGGGAVEIAWTPECFWRLFEATGSIWAYLIYRDLTDGESRWVLPILN